MTDNTIEPGRPSLGERILHVLTDGPLSRKDLSKRLGREPADVYRAVRILAELVVHLPGGLVGIAPVPAVGDWIDCTRKQLHLTPVGCYEHFLNATPFIDAALDTEATCVGCPIGAAVRVATAGAKVTPTRMGAVLRLAFGAEHGIGGKGERSDHLLAVAYASGGARD